MSTASLLLSGCAAIAGLDELRVGSTDGDAGLGELDASTGAVSAFDSDAMASGPGANVGEAGMGGESSGACRDGSCDASAGQSSDAQATADAAVSVVVDAALPDAMQTSSDAGAPDVEEDAGNGAEHDAGPRTADAGPSTEDAGKPDAGPSSVDAGAPTPDSGTSVVDAAPVDTDLGKGDGHDVILMGDSWMSNTLTVEGTGGGIAPALLESTGQSYRNYAVQGVELLKANAFGAAIPSQWDNAKSDNADIETVVMNGGMNDIIQGGSTLQDACSTGASACAAKLKEVRDALGALWAKMATAGVRDVVYVTYAKSAISVKDYAAHVSALQGVCDAVPASLRCHLLGTDSLVGASDLATDGIHPIEAANVRIAQAIADLMLSEGMRR